MEKLAVDEEGKITIPARVLSRRGLRPGDELLLVEADEGLLFYHRGTDPLAARWWDSLSGDERRRAQAEALGYMNLSEAERDHVWGGGTGSVEGRAEGGKGKRPTK
jgi:AbrB family looped-hinge helix DNA binding protein